MKAKTFIVILLASLVLTACGGLPTEAPVASVETPQPTITPDPCLSQNLPAEVTSVNSLMREFDDYAELASYTPQAQLIQIIPEMQRILRDAEDLQVPPCLEKLKEYQVAHMNVVVKTLLAFMTGADAQLINAGIKQAQETHQQYDAEKAGLLGVVISIPPSFAPWLVRRLQQPLLSVL